jgi:hypothetical protein
VTVEEIINHAMTTYGPILRARDGRRLTRTSTSTWARAVRRGDLVPLGRRRPRGEALFATTAVVRWAFGLTRSELN